MELFVDEVDVVAARGILDLEVFAGEAFVEKPKSPTVSPRRLGSNKVNNLLGVDGQVQGLQDSKVEAFVLQRESKVAAQAIFRLVPNREDAPVPNLAFLVGGTDGVQVVGSWPQPSINAE
ncbi:MAG: hypothetical protein V3W41_11350 [Planctomycetota bacterium]